MCVCSKKTSFVIQKSDVWVKKSNKKEPHKSSHLITQKEIQKTSTDKKMWLAYIYIKWQKCKSSCEIYHQVWEQINVIIDVNL